MSEGGRNGVRLVRRDANERLKKLLKTTRSPRTTSARGSTRFRRSPTTTSIDRRPAKKKTPSCR
jgi:ribosome recycling factor